MAAHNHIDSSVHVAVGELCVSAILLRNNNVNYTLDLLRNEMGNLSGDKLVVLNREVNNYILYHDKLLRLKYLNRINNLEINENNYMLDDATYIIDLIREQIDRILNDINNNINNNIINN